MQLPSAFSKVGRQGAQIAIIGWKGAIQLRHQTSDSGGLIDQDHVLSCLCKVQGGLDATQAATYDERLFAAWLIPIVFHDDLFITSDYLEAQSHAAHIRAGHGHVITLQASPVAV